MGQVLGDATGCGGVQGGLAGSLSVCLSVCLFVWSAASFLFPLALFLHLIIAKRLRKCMYVVGLLHINHWCLVLLFASSFVYTSLQTPMDLKSTPGTPSDRRKKSKRKTF